MGIFSTLFRSGPSRERLSAERLGFVVEGVRRDLPCFTRGNMAVKLSTGSCMRYAISRTGPLPRDTWSLLQRTKNEGATLPNNYLLVSDRPLSDELVRLLNLIASEFGEELFEFEGTASEVAVFWEEWGGHERVAKLHARLSQLAPL